MREPQDREDLLLHLPLLVRLEPAVEEAGGGGRRRRLLRLAGAPAIRKQRPTAGGGGGEQGRPQRRGPAATAQQPPPPAQPLRPPSQPRHSRPAGLAPWAPRGVEPESEAGAWPERCRCGPWREQPPPPLGGLASPSWPSVLISHGPLGYPQLPRMRGVGGERGDHRENHTPAQVAGSARYKPGASESGLSCGQCPRPRQVAER